MGRQISLRLPWPAPDRAGPAPAVASPILRRAPAALWRRTPRVDPSPLITRWLPGLVLFVLVGVSAAVAPLLWEAAAGPAPVAAGSVAEAVALGLTTGRAVELTVAVEDTRRVRSPQRGSATYYAPVVGGGLLVRTDDPDRLRQRPATVAGHIVPLQRLDSDARLRPALSDDQGRPVAPDVPVLVERNVVGDALLAAVALLVAWASALGSLWITDGRSAVAAAPRTLRPVRRAVQPEKPARSA